MVGELSTVDDALVAFGRRRNPDTELEVVVALDDAGTWASGTGEASFESTPGEQTKWTVVGQSGSNDRKTSFRTRWS